MKYIFVWSYNGDRTIDQAVLYEAESLQHHGKALFCKNKYIGFNIPTRHTMSKSIKRWKFTGVWFYKVYDDYEQAIMNHFADIL